MAKKLARDLIREAKREFRRCKAELEPGLLAKAAQELHLANQDFRNVVVAQNAIRPCLEAVIEEMLPFSHLTALELAIRLASYCLSTAPAEDQDKLTSLFLQGFTAAHQTRLSMGIRIKTEWVTDGEPGRVPNSVSGPIAHPKGTA